MPEPPLQPTPMLDLTAPLIPARSRLYSLAPIGVGTPLVESLTSYLTRLAGAHRVTVGTLAAAEIAPLVNRAATAAHAKMYQASHNLNGWDTWTPLTLAALTDLTRQPDLAFLTMQPWRNVLARQNLLRRHLTWCPACFNHWQQTGQPLYIPLVWLLKPVTCCPRHQQPLNDRCPYPDCAHSLRPINSRVPLGYCPACRRWLGLTDQTAAQISTPANDSERETQLWVTAELARLLAATPLLAAAADPAVVIRNFKRCAAASVPGNPHALARELRLSYNWFSGWLNRGKPLQLGMLAQVCHYLGMSVLDLLTIHPGQDNDPLPPEPADLPPARIPVEPDTLRCRLEHILAVPHTPQESAAQVAKQLGVTVRTIQYHYPEQYQHIVRRHLQDQQAQRQVRNHKLADDLQAILDSDEIPPPSLTEVARRFEVNPRTVRANCPELSRAISRKWKLFFEARDAQVEADLRQILAKAETPPPTINQVAARLNEKVGYLYRKFPDLCQAVTQRHREAQPLTPEKRPAAGPVPPPQPKNPTDQRRRFMALIATGATPPPTLVEAARQLGCTTGRLQYKYPDLCRQLIQQWQDYRRQRHSAIEGQLRDLLVVSEGPLLVRDMLAQLDIDLNTLKRWFPEQYAEIIHRNRAAQQAERHRRQAHLARIITENPTPSLSLSQVAEQLECRDTVLRRQFPQQSQIIVDRYQGYREQEYATARAALEAALNDAQHPPVLPLQVAHQLGYDNKQYLQNHFPDLCHQLAQRYEEQRRRLAQAQLAAAMAQPTLEPPSLPAISRQLGYRLSSLKHLCPDLCQMVEARYQTHYEQKHMAAKEALVGIVNGTRPPIPAAAVAREVGLSCTVIQRRFPELVPAVSVRYQEFAYERGEQRRQQLDDEVKQITRSLVEAGINPTLRQVILRLSSPAAAKAPHVRLAWQAARQELGLPV